MRTWNWRPCLRGMVPAARVPARCALVQSLFFARLLIVVTLLWGPIAFAGDWPGWRGCAREGVSASANLPTSWSREENVRWRTEIPGEGHSSPIVSADAVYVTTARMVAPHTPAAAALQYLLIVATLLVAILAIHYVVSRCVGIGGPGASWRGLIDAAAVGAMVLASCFMVLFGEGFVHFSRGPERGWLVASLLGTLLLLASARYGRGAGASMPVRFGSLLVFGGILQATLPNIAHAYEDGLLSPKSLFHYLVVAVPVVAGALVWAQYLANGAAAGRARDPGAGARRAGRLWGTAIRIAVGLLAAALVVLTSIMVATEQQKGGATLTVAQPYEPVVGWWVLGAALVIAIGAVVARIRIGSAFGANLAVVISLLILLVVCSVVGFERLVAGFPYLNYHLGMPDYGAMVGGNVAWAFLGVCLAVLVIFVVAGQRLAPVVHLIASARAFHAAAVFVSVAYVIYAVYIPKQPRLTRSIMSIDRHTGAIQWISDGLAGPRARMHTDNSSATPTPVTDGTQVYAWFGTPGLVCVDRRGDRVWHTSDVPFDSRHGVSSSPILCGGNVIILSESELGGYLAAVDCGSGDMFWRTERGKSIHRYAGNCRTPIVKRVQGEETIIVWGHRDVSGYDPRTGKEMWSHNVGDLGEMNNPVATMVSDDRRLYLVGPRETIALEIEKLPSDGDPIAWRQPTKRGAQCASPVVIGGRLFAVSDHGVAYCINTDDGRTLWTQRLRGQHYSSVLSDGERVYFTSTAGKTRVAAASDRYEPIGENDLGENVSASIAPADGELFIRSSEALYCIAE